MHENEVLADETVVRRLLLDQLPELARLPLTRLPPTGTDNLIYRLGDELSVRLPRIDWAVEQIALDHAWLPRIAPSLPCAVSEPVAVGGPGHGYPYPWAVHRWLPGANPERGDHPRLAEDLGAFVVALRQLTDGPPSSRSGPLSTRDTVFRDSLAMLADEYDVASLAALWEDCLAVPEHTGPQVWRHADLIATNLLVMGGRLAAVIDFGPSGLGDPAVDLTPAWATFDGRAREVFRDTAWLDEPAWERARGWALSVAVIALAYYRGTSPEISAQSRRTIEAVR